MAWYLGLPVTLWTWLLAGALRRTKLAELDGWADGEPDNTTVPGCSLRALIAALKMVANVRMGRRSADEELLAEPPNGDLLGICAWRRGAESGQGPSSARSEQCWGNVIRRPVWTAMA